MFTSDDADSVRHVVIPVQDQSLQQSVSVGQTFDDPEADYISSDSD